jgi:hypothetical protein
MTPSGQKVFSRPELDGGHCLYQDEPFLPQSFRFLEAAFLHLAGGRRSDWETCPPVLTVGWREVFNPYRDREIAAAFKGRTVLVSASVSGVSDLAQTDLHADLPGVYLHALAAESLSRFAVGPGQQSQWYYRILLFMVGSLAVFHIRDWYEQRRDRPAERSVSTLTISDTSRVTRTDDATHRQSVVRAEETITAELSPALKPQGEPRPKKWTIKPVWPVLAALAVVYFLCEWKLSLAGRDLLFFVVCNTDEIWWLDPTRVFHSVIDIFKERLQNDEDDVSVPEA